jgi:tetratricopeptide (TPR) repeat protein
MRYYFIILLFFLSSWAYSQENPRIQQVKYVFESLVQAYANGKTRPALEINPISSGKYYIAQYSSKDGKHTITIDEKLIDLCYKFGKDSLNSIALIISHELAHYYNDHGWCSDYAFAINKTNKELSIKLKESSKASKLEKEILADRYGLFYAAVAGYSNFTLFQRVLNEVYEKYKLPAQQPGYPSLTERKKIVIDAGIKADELYKYFNSGVIAFNQNRYLDAIDLFEKANSYIPFRENYNNIGVSKVRLALLLRPITKEEADFPDRFLYPIEIENKSRINRDNTRSLDEDGYGRMIELLKSAQKDFQEAIRIDPSYMKGHINLACVFDLLRKPEAAIGQISQTDEINSSRESNRILAIAYYHNGQVDNAKNIWIKLGL